VGGKICIFVVGGAVAVGGIDSNFGKLLLVVCTVCCVCGSTDLGELVSVGKR
jgi:hypothetical protein